MLNVFVFTVTGYNNGSLWDILMMLDRYIYKECAFLGTHADLEECWLTRNLSCCALLMLCSLSLLIIAPGYFKTICCIIHSWLYRMRMFIDKSRKASTITHEGFVFWYSLGRKLRGPKFTGTTWAASRRSTISGSFLVLKRRCCGHLKALATL